MTEETAKEVPAGDSGPEKVAPEEGVNPRGKWSNNKEFIFAIAGEVMGLVNIWHFPYMCMRNGGGTFLIPYFVMLFFLGMPMFFLETALGQYTSEGGVTAWRKICPMFEGVGIASQVIVGYINIYFIVVLAWAIFYLFNSFKSPLPWSSCDNWWNTEVCQDRASPYADPHVFEHGGSNWSFLHNITTPDYNNFNYTADFDPFLHKSPEEEFWDHRVLRSSDDMSLRNLNWKMVGCLLLAWIVCYLCVFKGIKSTGKVVYFTATFPSMMLFILFIRGVTLPGAGEGLKYYLLPDFSKIASVNIWFDAGKQVLFSFALCKGVLTAMGSYNKYNNNCYRDCLALCCLTCATSIFAGFAVFSVLGFLAHDMGVEVSEVASAGLRLFFVVFAKAVSLLPVSSFWAVLVFLMLCVQCLHSQLVCVESLATTITDLFPRHLRRPGAREVLVLVIAGVCFLLGLPLLTEGGIVLFSLIDNFGPCAINILFIVCFETIVIAWVYGADRFYDNIEDMIGYPPFPVLKYCWLFITPLICGVSLLYELADYQQLVIGGYIHGTWGTILGMLLIITPMMCIPAFILISLYKNGEKMTTPSSDLRQARPHKPILTLCKYVIFKAEVQPNRHVEENNEKMMMGEPSVV